MASTNKTQNLKLPQWVATDKPEMQDFNEAFESIETEVGKRYTKDDVNRLLDNKANIYSSIQNPYTIYSNSDLNEKRDIGFYSCAFGSASVTNCPSTAPFVMIVAHTRANGNGVMQIVFSASGHIYIRHIYDNKFSEWLES